MIENFSYIIEDGTILELKLDVGVDKFEGVEESKVKSFFKAKGRGVRWKFHSSEIEIFEAGRRIDGFPTHDLKRVVVIYPKDHTVYPAPSNGAIYDPNGNKTIQLKVPELISPAAKQLSLREKKINMNIDASFRGVSWNKDSNGKICTVVSIDFYWEWWESRTLNPETGEFGECIGSGRR